MKKWISELLRQWWTWLVRPVQEMDCSLRILDEPEERVYYPVSSNGHCKQTESGTFERKLDTVLLRTAYRWTCLHCGASYYEQPVPMELTPDELDVIAKSLGRDDIRDFQFTVPPETVICDECGYEYITEESDEFEPVDEDQDEEDDD